MTNKTNQNTGIQVTMRQAPFEIPNLRLILDQDGQNLLLIFKSKWLQNRALWRRT